MNAFITRLILSVAAIGSIAAGVAVPVLSAASPAVATAAGSATPDYIGHLG